MDSVESVPDRSFLLENFRNAEGAKEASSLSHFFSGLFTLMISRGKEKETLALNCWFAFTVLDVYVLIYDKLSVVTVDIKIKELVPSSMAFHLHAGSQWCEIAKTSCELFFFWGGGGGGGG